MSYTYPQALTALESIANDFIKLMRPNMTSPVYLRCDVHSETASVTWSYNSIRVNMPIRPAVSVMQQGEFDDWVAYLLHELGHPTFTDKATWENAVRAGLGRLTNALEDVRMEKAVIASGIVPNAKAVLSRLISRKVVQARADGWKPNSRAEFGWTVCVLGRAANGYALDQSDLTWIKRQIKPGSTVATVLAWALPVLDACQSTADCVALAARIAKALATPQGLTDKPTGGFPGKPGTQGGPGDEGDEGEGDEGEGEGQPGKGEGEGQPGEGPSEGQPGPQEGQPGEGEQGEGEEGERASGSQNAPEGPSGEGSEGDSEGGKGGTGHGDGTTDADETPIADDSELTERGLAPDSTETVEPGQSANAEKDVITILRDQVMVSQPKDGPANPRKMGPNGQRMKDAAAQASRQRALLARALRATETDEREGGKRAGRLDRGSLARIVTGSQNVFERRDVSEGYDTDVCVLLDASGSMGGSNMVSALEVGLVIAQAAGSVGASCTTEIFNSTGYARAGGLASKRQPNPADYGALINSATGGTPLSAHMARAAVAQAKRAPGKRRVLFVITDGGCDYGPATVKRMVAYLEKACGTIMAHASIGIPPAGAFRAEVHVPYGVAVSDVGLDHFVKVLQAL